MKAAGRTWSGFAGMLLVAVACTSETALQPPSVIPSDLPKQITLPSTLVGIPSSSSFEIRNQGVGPLSLSLVSLGGEGAFTLVGLSSEGVALAPGSRRELTFRFEAREAGTFSADATFSLGTAERLEVMKLQATAYGSCQVKSAGGIDFGPVAMASPVEREALFLNESPLPVPLRLSLRAETASVGDFTSSVNLNALEIPARLPGKPPGQLAVPIRFAPSAVGPATAALLVDSPAFCDAARVPLVGDGKENLIACEPAAGDVPTFCTIDFGDVPPGLSVTRSVSLRNHTDKPLPIEVAKLTTNEFRLASESATQLQGPLSPEGMSLAFVFAPSEVGYFLATANFTVTGTRERVQVFLVGHGGGPALSLTPVQMQLGEIAVGQEAVRVIRLTNSGLDIPASPSDRLHLTEAPSFFGDDAGAWVEWPRPFPDAGLAAGQSIDLELHVRPTAAGFGLVYLRIASNDAMRPIAEATIDWQAVMLPPCHATIAPDRLDFGQAPSGESLVRSVRLHNLGSDPSERCLVRDLSVSGDAFELASAGEEPFFVEPGATIAIDLRFAPPASAPGTIHPGLLRLSLSDGASTETRIPLSGVSGGCVEVMTPELSFGAIAPGCSSSWRPVRLVNACDADAHVSTVSLLPPSKGFELGSTVTLPAAISPGGAFELPIRFTPPAVGEWLGTAAIGAPWGFTVPLDGVGASAPPRVDMFHGRTGLDLLFIVDNSMSMEPHQWKLAQRATLEALLAPLEGMSLHVAVTTSSIDEAGFPRPGRESGQFYVDKPGAPSFLDSATPGLLDALATRVVPGLQGKTREELLRPMVLALSPPLILEANAGFLRSEAALAVFIVSDTADQDLFATPLDFYEQFLLSLKGSERRGDILVGGLVPAFDGVVPPGCAEIDPAFTDAQLARVHDLAEDFGGLVGDVCAADYSDTMRRIGETVARRRSLPLSATPAPGRPIVVEVNGSPLPEETGGVRAWHFDKATNAVWFDVEVPASATVAVRYEAGC